MATRYGIRVIRGLTGHMCQSFYLSSQTSDHLDKQSNVTTPYLTLNAPHTYTLLKLFCSCLHSSWICLDLFGLLIRLQTEERKMADADEDSCIGTKTNRSIYVQCICGHVRLVWSTTNFLRFQKKWPFLLNNSDKNLWNSKVDLQFTAH